MESSALVVLDARDVRAVSRRASKGPIYAVPASNYGTHMDGTHAPSIGTAQLLLPACSGRRLRAKFTAVPKCCGVAGRCPAKLAAALQLRSAAPPRAAAPLSAALMHGFTFAAPRMRSAEVFARCSYELVHLRAWPGAGCPPCLSSRALCVSGVRAHAQLPTL